MEAREYLKQIEICQQRFDTVSSELVFLESLIQQKIDEDLKKNLKRKREEYSKAAAEYARMRTEVIDRIHEINDIDLERVLVLRYVNLMKFENIADKLSYSYDYIRHKHQKALDAFEKIINNKP